MPDAIRSGLRRSRALLIPCLAFGLAVCGRGNQQQAAGTTMDTTGMMGGAVPPAAEAAPPAGATTALSAPQVSAVLSASDSAEIKPSQLAQQKAQNAEVKAYAQRMLKDHGMLEDSLRALDKRENISPAPNPLSQQLESQTESTMKRLQSLSGAEFDQAYMQAMVQSHTEALNVVDNQLLPATQDPQLRVAISQKVRPTIVSHLDAARQIQQSLASGGSGAR